MSIELENPQTLPEKIDAASNFVSQMMLAHKTGDEKHFMAIYERASSLLHGAMQDAEKGSPIHQLAALRDLLSDGQADVHFEISSHAAYGWIAALAPKDAVIGAIDTYHAFGKGDTPDAACVAALDDHWQRWLAEVRRIDKERGWNLAPEDGDAWREYYDDGFSPAEALDEEANEVSR